MICSIRHNPSKLPKFHIDEILEGVGKLINEELKILIKGFFFNSFIIYFVDRKGPWLE